jgi:hypothetical protein
MRDLFVAAEPIAWSTRPRQECDGKEPRSHGGCSPPASPCWRARRRSPRRGASATRGRCSPTSTGASRPAGIKARSGLEPNERVAYLSKTLIDLWARADAKVPQGDAGPIDWDVTTNSQGMEVGSYTVKVAHLDAARANLIVTLTAKTPWTRKSPDENIVRYHFVRENGRWVIDDIRGANNAEKSGLKDLLTRAANE